MNIIEIKDLKKKFGKTQALGGVNLAVKEGEVFGFLGPNGAGKTTTIRCLMSFIRPSSGAISIFGKNVATDSVQIKREIGYLAGNVKLYPSWTGAEHIKFVEGIRGESKIAQDLIKKLDFNPNIKFKNLSSGNKQKMGLILALMSEPKLLIMDEPTVGLDPLLQNTIYEILADLKKRGTTILVSSHNLPEVERICDRVGIIKEGKMVAVETLKELSGKKIHIVEVRFAKKVKKSEFNIPGIENVEELPDGFIFNVSGEIDRVVKTLAKYEVTDIQITHAALEDVFLKFYQKQG